MRPACRQTEGRVVETPEAHTRAPTRRLRTALTTAAAVAAVSACALGDLVATGSDLEDAGYEVTSLNHDLDHDAATGDVDADLELLEEHVDETHGEEAAEIIWRSIGDEVDQIDLEIVGADQSDYARTWTRAELQDRFGEPEG
ncbi:hypothetical protein [Ornithinimicrobium sediminis]|uniref:hypothetical protein n=1 Tax=Ornithinimicrobium sediminis TaxID=2904603 RepID=UPI001E5B2891|nr:hypothetical protein [Ornithinimicrobium sediminis]MCE0485878.1 hypothetical protein [Ornithinimicrobium sediminis]